MNRRQIERVLARNARIARAVDENLGSVIAALLAAGERDVAYAVASAASTYPAAVLGDDGVAEAKAAAAAGQAELARAIRDELARHGITSREDLAAFTAAALKRPT